jgi:hypothetical protein
MPRARRRNMNWARSSASGLGAALSCGALIAQGVRKAST